jgi:hypothetical protein
MKSSGRTMTFCANLKASLTPCWFLVASQAMKLKWILSLALATGALSFSGCVETIDGRHRAGVPLASDTVDGRYERSPADLWAAAKDVLKYQGTLLSEDTLKNVLEASVDERRVWVKVEEFDTKTTRVLVQARGKGGGADMQMAAFIDKQIAVRLASGNLTPAAPVRR